MGLNEVPLSMSLLDYGVGTILANFHMYYRRPSNQGLSHRLLNSAIP